MEKLIYPLWREEGSDPDVYRDGLLRELAPQLLDVGVQGLRLAVVDSAVAPAAAMRQEQLCSAPAALVSVWVHSAVERQPLEACLADSGGHFHGYAVTESTPLQVQEREGERTPGMNQVVFLQRPQRLSRQEWLSIWLESHTPVAIATQATFSYRQNIVVRPLTQGAPAIDAIVEEGFPAAAMTSPLAFYGADSDEELQARLKTMIDSCTRFIDFDRLNLTATSDYLLKRLAPA